jgi:NAD(P)-dependent dehydrogenase (short-subunit alcohol dehydrogenase family)
MPTIPPGEAILDAKNCIVTGASRGLGTFIARELLRDGANLLLVGSAATRLAECCDELRAVARPGQTVDACVADLSEPDSAERVVDAAWRAWPRLDGLVNNAAIQGPIGVAWITNGQAGSGQSR